MNLKLSRTSAMVSSAFPLIPGVVLQGGVRLFDLSQHVCLSVAGVFRTLAKCLQLCAK